jgi:hypothetical protein
MCAEALGICSMEQQVVFTSLFLFLSGVILFDHPYSRMSSGIYTAPHPRRRHSS